MTFKKIIVISFLAISLTACMGVKFTYNNLDWVIPWYMDDYLSLSDQQEKSFDDQLEALLLWHRQNELSDYSDHLHQIASDLGNQKINDEKLKSYTEKIRILYWRLIDKSLENGTALISSLSEQQVAYTLESLADNDDDFREYVADMDLKERIKERRKSVTKLFRKWIGRLSKDQKNKIHQWSNEVETTLEYHVAYVSESRVFFKQALEERNNQQQTHQSLLKLATHPELLRSKSYNDVIVRNDRRFRELLLNVLQSLSKKQQRKLHKKLLKYANAFSELSEQDTH